MKHKEDTDQEKFKFIIDKTDGLISEMHSEARASSARLSDMLVLAIQVTGLLLPTIFLASNYYEVKEDDFILMSLVVMSLTLIYLFIKTYIYRKESFLSTHKILQDIIGKKDNLMSDFGEFGIDRALQILQDSREGRKQDKSIEGLIRGSVEEVERILISAGLLSLLGLVLFMLSFMCY